MTTYEKVELALIPVFGVVVWTLTPELPSKMGVGTLLLWASALLLFQGLVRDVWLLRKAKVAKQTAPVRKLSCMCVESTVGAIGVIIGMALLGVDLDKLVGMNRCAWSLLPMLTVSIGFVIKELVVTWNPWRILREKDHLNIVFTWKA